MKLKLYLGAIVALSVALSSSSLALAENGTITPIPTPTPQAGSYGLQATKTQAPPTTGATINTPSNGSSSASSPITVGGICPTGLLVEVFDNGKTVRMVVLASRLIYLMVRTT